MEQVARRPSAVGWRLTELPAHVDSRGVLVPHEFGELPFHPQRVFVVSGVVPGTTRGGHAHRTAWQLLQCPAGSVTVELRHDGSHVTVTLDRPDRGLVVEPGVWSSQTFETDGTVLVVLSSEPYHADSYLDEPVR